ncbi:MAG: IMPACT family protein [Dethiobacteria bacterium]|jgi:uncharacterized YigZ family protein|nr:YigZ family protein [Bacillota bacterium]
MRVIEKMDDQYLTVARAARAKIRVGACRFIASIAPCADEAEAKEFIKRVQYEFHDATHNAYAYRLGLDGALARCDDDWEPAGSSGPPMLQALETHGLVYTVVVGTRYFGGVKLGIGGLVRAYRSCAEAGIKAAGICKKTLMKPLRIVVSYDNLGTVLRAISSFGGELKEQDFGEEVCVHCLIRASRQDSFAKHLVEQTSGKVRIEKK